MKIIDAHLMPLPTKHYSTDVKVAVSVGGEEYYLMVSVSGYAPNASAREKEQGWEPDWGMDHIESEAHLGIAQTIVAALTELSCVMKGQDDEP